MDSVSRVKTSATHSVLIRRPSLNAPKTKSGLQRSFGPSGNNIGLRRDDGRDLSLTPLGPPSITVYPNISHENARNTIESRFFGEFQKKESPQNPQGNQGLIWVREGAPIKRAE
jgi:hypothetical protein